MQLHDATDSNEEKVRIYHSLGSNKSEKLIQRCLDFALSVSGTVCSIVITNIAELWCVYNSA